MKFTMQWLTEVSNWSHLNFPRTPVWLANTPHLWDFSHLLYMDEEFVRCKCMCKTYLLCKLCIFVYLCYAHVSKVCLSICYSVWSHLMPINSEHAGLDTWPPVLNTHCTLRPAGRSTKWTKCTNLSSVILMAKVAREIVVCHWLTHNSFPWRWSKYGPM